MFGLGFWETIVILLVIIVLVKPSDLPAFMRKAGQFIGKARSAYDTLKNSLARVEYDERMRSEERVVPALGQEPESLMEPEGLKVMKKRTKTKKNVKKAKSKKRNR